MKLTHATIAVILLAVSMSAKDKNKDYTMVTYEGYETKVVPIPSNLQGPGTGTELDIVTFRIQLPDGTMLSLRRLSGTTIFDRVQVGQNIYLRQEHNKCFVQESNGKEQKFKCWID
jgi:hypothetical protein